MNCEKHVAVVNITEMINLGLGLVKFNVPLDT